MKHGPRTFLPFAVAGICLVAMTASLLAERPPAGERFKRPAPVRGGSRALAEERRVTDAQRAVDRGRVEEARALLKGVDPALLPRALGEAAAFLSASIAEDAGTVDRLLDEYLNNYPRGPHRRAAALALAKSQYAQGDYREAENLLSIFSPGVERDPLGRDGLIWRGLSQLDRGIRSAGPPMLGLPIGGGYAIQVGAFARRELAEALGKDLRLAGVGDVAVLEGREATPIYRVRAGAYATRDEARALGERLRR